MNKREEQILAGALQQQAVNMGGAVGGEYVSLCKRVGGRDEGGLQKVFPAWGHRRTVSRSRLKNARESLKQ